MVVLSRGSLGWGLMMVVVWGGAGGGSGRGWSLGDRRCCWRVHWESGGCAGSEMELISGLRAWVFVVPYHTLGPPTRFATTKFQTCTWSHITSAGPEMHNKCEVSVLACGTGYICLPLRLLQQQALFSVPALGYLATCAALQCWNSAPSLCSVRYFRECLLISVQKPFLCVHHRLSCTCVALALQFPEKCTQQKLLL